MAKDRSIVGAFEIVSFPELDVLQEVAKMDTGAYSGALHCTDMKVVKRGLMRKKVLKFTPLGDEKLATETENFVSIHVRSATGHRLKRYQIDTTITIKGKSYPIRIGLSDRSDLKRNILIGRRFLRENNMLVDVRINQEHDDEGDNIR